MSVDNKIKMVMSSAGVNGRQLSEAFNCSPQTATNKITRGIKSISDLLTIITFCGGSVQLLTKDGTVIPLTLEDLEGGK